MTEGVVAAPMAGLYRAVVVANADPARKMRLRLSIPDLGLATSAWAMPCVPVGSTAVPEVGAQVWVMFEGGDAAHPVWIGTLGEVP